MNNFLHICIRDSFLSWCLIAGVIGILIVLYFVINSIFEYLFEEKEEK